MPPSLDLAAVEERIRGTPFAGTVQHFATVGSTSTLALEAGQAGAASGVWVADRQTAGRGRGGHAWHSAAGEGLYASVLVRPRLQIVRALLLSLATGLAAREAIAEVSGMTPDLRWPNDLMRGEKKCGGILVETSVAANTEPAVLRYAVIGIGINIAQASFPAELAALATSLLLETGKLCPRELLLSALLRALDRQLALLHTAPQSVLDLFSNVSTWPRGKRVRVGEQDGYTGTTAGLNADGFLLVDGDDGVRRTVLSGGVRAIS